MLVLGIIAGSSYEEKIQIPNNGRRIPAVLTKMMYLCLAKEKTSIIILSCLAWNVGKINVLTSSGIWNIFADPCNSYEVSTLFFNQTHLPMILSCQVFSITFFSLSAPSFLIFYACHHLLIHFCHLLWCICLIVTYWEWLHPSDEYIVFFFRSLQYKRVQQTREKKRPRDELPQIIHLHVDEEEALEICVAFSHLFVDNRKLVMHRQCF